VVKLGIQYGDDTVDFRVPNIWYKEKISQV